MRREDVYTAKRIIELALQNTKAATIASQYKRIKPGSDGRIRTVLSPVGTETSRLASSDSFLEESTNLQNISNKVGMLDTLFEVRAAIIAKPGHLLVEADMSQAEARCTSAFCKDKAALEMFDSGRDIHKWTASKIFHCQPDEVTKEQRHLGKVARHALNYGMGWALFLDEINGDADLTGIAISAAEAKAIVSAYHADNQCLLTWWEEVWQEVLASGYLVNPFGRRRDFLSPYVRKTDVVAYKPQSTIADLLCNRMSDLYEQSPLGDYMLLQVHDSLVLEVPAAEAKDAAIELREWISAETVDIDGYQLRIPAEAKIGERWSELEKVK